jgi:formate dehydrogenase iron-sulfur subunit
MSKPNCLSRREFLKRVGGSAVALTATCLLAEAPLAFASAQASEEVASETPGILIDLTRCVGCNSCALACKVSNKLSEPQVVPHAFDKEVYTFVERRQGTTASGAIKVRYVKRQCMHCQNAACVSACPAAAMHRSAEGPVIYSPELCLGCRYCQVACPFEVPSFNWEDGVTPTISKCWLCYERLQEGQAPACTQACPTGALRFGKRNELLDQAHAQITSNAGRYIDHVFGESEVGGTSMLYLSDVPFEQLGFPANLPLTAPPEETEKIMTKLPYVIAGVATLMTGAAIITHRSPIHDMDKGEQPQHASPKREG